MMISLIIFSITLPNFTFVYADEIDSENQNAISSEQAIISAEKDQEVPLYEEMDEDSEVLTTLYDEDVVTILEEFETFSLIEYSEEETEEVNVEDKIWQGYVSNEYLEQSGDDLSAPEGDPNQQTEGDTTEGTGDESGKEVNTEDGNDKVKSTEDGNSINKTTRHADSVGKSSNDDKPENVEINITSLNNGTFNGIALKDKTIVYEKQSKDSKALKKYSKGSILKYRGLNDNWYEATVSVNGKWVKGYIHTDDVENAVKDQKTVRGVALKSNTHVYKSASTSSKSLKSYKQGTLLKYKTYTSDWYEATVKVNGDWKTGYIHKTHVEEPTSNQETFRGIALKSKTHVYANPSTSSKKLKSYSQGSLLKYQTYTSDWYEATVKVNGKWVTGYIHKSHVEEPLKKQETLNGIASKSPTHVYKKASTTSGSWKSYSQGTLLKYKTYTSDWYEATVYVKGKKQTGYIHKSHVEEPTSNQETLHGISLKSKTHVYANPSTTSKRLKSYKIGKKLKYRTFTKNWYEATVKVKGKWETGYIHKSHVDEPVNTTKTLQGIGLKNKTHVYSEASTSAKKLKSYAQGTLLKYKTFSKNWYEATVKVNGKWRTGYIHKSHVEEPVNKQKTLHGIALKSKTHIYAKASTSSKKLKSYNQGTVLKFKTFTNSWYEATVKVKGKWVTGYIHKSHVNSEMLEYTNYNLSLEEAIDIQLKKFDKKNRPSRAEMKKYLDPSNNDKFQHLRLDTSLGVSASQLNRLLKGTLSGQGQSFIEGGKRYGVNEAYLLSHAIHETGNGSSALSNGSIKVGEISNNKWVSVNGSNGEIFEVTRTIKDGKTEWNVKKVNSYSKEIKLKVTYNMFGIGAHDGVANPLGSVHAYIYNWDSPKKAILGGTEWISKQYIQNIHKQNTLYKMKWNPNMSDGYAWKQYATDIGWAVKQTTNIKNIYAQLNNPIYHYDIPKYK